MRPILFLSFFLVTCTEPHQPLVNVPVDEEEKSTLSDLPAVNDQFQAFLDKFPKVNLPVVIKGCEAEYEHLVEFNEENRSPYLKDNSFAYGQIKTNGAYVAVITLGIADCFLPVLTTYKLSGEKLDSKTIAIGYGGSDPCFESIEYMILRDDFTIYTADTMKTWECDENDKAIPGTEKMEVIYKEGRLTEKGMIELSGEKVERF